MDLAKIFEIAKMVGIILCALFALGFTIAYLIGGNEYNGKFVRPWEKAERKAVRKREKEERRARREFWKT